MNSCSMPRPSVRINNDNVTAPVDALVEFENRPHALFRWSELAVSVALD